MVQLQEIKPQLSRLGYQLIAVCPDRPAKLAQTIQKRQLDYLLLSDSKMIGAQSFGLAFRVDDETLARQRSRGVDLEDASGEKHHLLPVPSVFVIGTDGVINFEYINPNPLVRIKMDLLLAAAKAALE